MDVAAEPPRRQKFGRIAFRGDPPQFDRTMMTGGSDGNDALEALLLDFAGGDAGAARALIAELAPRLLRFATRLLHDVAEAEDVVQETLVRLWKVAPDWRRGEAKVSTWTFRVASNLAIDRIRARSRLSVSDTEVEPASDAPGPAERLSETERARALDAALARLPARQRQAVVLRHIEGLANPEIAAIMSVSVEAVESLVARGKRELRAILMPMKEGLSHDRP